ncbi:MAG: Gfo/Idh/MocA family oxidoreductase [Kiritimatiellae bacterium]|nr:Gfo/Idh/MocA family oxidoreductase [Kiritimatiellia bacterium]MDD5522329.1 Gfo/Idh/MocA family oxidoreductase [Kiritimatiellia bacterium]
MKEVKPLRIACIGCGARAQTYTQLMVKRPDRFQVVAGADLVPERVEKMRKISNNPGFQGFSDIDKLFAVKNLADVIIIATQDNYHYIPCGRALELGYNVLLEKPIATQVDQVLEVERLALRANRRVMVCFVLRFAAFYRKVKEIIDSGALGEIVSIQANEGVMPWHQAHSFVRGHWSVVGKSSPMILSKCCHDTDIVYWLVGRRCRKIASFGSLEYFRSERAPAGAPARCTDGCPVGKECPYNALRYAGDMRDPWLGMVYDRAQEASPEAITSWLKTSPWGRCVYHCDNDAVDRQVLAMEFEGGVTGTFTMTAFAYGRHIEVYGTRGVLKGGETYRQHFGSHLVLIPHEGEVSRYTVQAEDGGYELHGGGDPGLVNALYEEMTKPDGAPLEAAISSTVHGHIIGFAAEEARQTGQTVDIEQFQKMHLKKK